VSLSRLALRLAAVEALRPSATGSAGPFPTLAGPRVYDSRLDVIDTLSDIDAKPMLLVYTEEQNNKPYGNAVHRPDESIVTLVVEISVALRGEVEIAHPDGTTETVNTVETPLTDREHEALLDVLEATVRRVFDRNATVASAALFFLVAMEVRAIESEPLRDADKTTRLAARTLKFTVKVVGDRWPVPTLPPSPAATGLARLPEPLASVARAVPSTSSAGALLARVAAWLPDPDGLTPLAAINPSVALDRGTPSFDDVAGVVLTET